MKWVYTYTARTELAYTGQEDTRQFRLELKTCTFCEEWARTLCSYEAHGDVDHVSGDNQGLRRFYERHWKC